MAHQHVTNSYMEHGLCLNWEPPLVFLHVGSDIVTAISYYSIPLAMFYFAYRRRDLPFYKIFVMFAVFILSCGTTHLFAAYTIYRPEYWIEGYVKAFTAIVSAITAVIFIPRLPEAISFPSIVGHLEEVKKLNSELDTKNTALQESEALFRSMIEYAPEAVVLYDLDTKLFVDANEKAVKLFGCDKEKLLQGGPGRFYLPYLPDGRPVSESIFDNSTRALSGEEIQFERVVHSDDGRDITCEVRLVRLPSLDKRLLRGSYIDITERKLALEELRKSKEFLEITQRSAGAGSWTWDFDTDQLNWSPEQYKIFGLKPVVGIATFDLWQSVVHPDDLEVARSNINNAISDHTDLLNEYRIIKPTGEIRWINAYGQTSYDDLGKPQRMSGICLDITDRKKIENIQSDLLRFASLHPNEDFFQSLASYLAYTLNMDYVCIDRLHGDNLVATTLAVYHNGEFEDNVTYTLKDTPCGDVVGKEVCVFPTEVRNLFPKDEALQVLQAESYVGTTLWSFDMKPIGLIAVIGRNPLKDTRFSETVLKLVSNRAAGELERRQVELEKRELEQQFQQTQKLESLGVLAGGIAHDFNNILAIIMGYSALIKMDYETAEENIPQIEKAAERAAALCRQMLAYAGKATLTQTQVNMWMLVDEMVNMLKTTIPQNVVIKAELSTDIPFIMGDASQIRQIAMNLIINASEAIGKEQGEIKVLLTKATVTTGQSDKDYHGKVIPPSVYVCLEVTDTGCGMDEETKWRIFEPFYTTKFTGRGLGMSAVLGIIQAHNGSLQLFSEQGKGTTFKVYLPVKTSGSDKDEYQKQPDTSAPWLGSGTILLVEDEEPIRIIAKALLKKIGFTVVEAVNGKEALELYQKNATDITLVMTDMGMPVMDGYELFHELKKLNPGLPIIVSSGYGDAEVSSRIDIDDIAGLISKPYNPNQLREVLKGIVEGAKL